MSSLIVSPSSGVGVLGGGILNVVNQTPQLVAVGAVRYGSPDNVGAPLPFFSLSDSKGGWLVHGCFSIKVSIVRFVHVILPKAAYRSRTGISFALLVAGRQRMRAALSPFGSRKF